MRYIVTIVLDSSNPDKTEIERTIDAAIRFNSRVKRMLAGQVQDVEVVKLGKPSQMVANLMEKHGA